MKSPLPRAALLSTVVAIGAAGCASAPEPPPAVAAAPLPEPNRVPPFRLAGVFVAKPQLKPNVPGATTLELYLFPDGSYMHAASGGTMTYGIIADRGVWSYADGELALVTAGPAPAPQGTRTFMATIPDPGRDGLWPTISEDWDRQHWVPELYGFERAIAASEVEAEKERLEYAFGRFSPAAIPSRFPMTGPAKGQRLSNGSYIVYEFESIVIAGVPVKAERVELSRGFKEVRIVRPTEIPATLRSTPELTIFIDGELAPF